jgi:hypothetical protein
MNRKRGPSVVVLARVKSESTTLAKVVSEEVQGFLFLGQRGEEFSNNEVVVESSHDRGW